MKHDGEYEFKDEQSIDKFVKGLKGERLKEVATDLGVPGRRAMRADVLRMAVRTELMKKMQREEIDAPSHVSAPAVDKEHGTSVTDNSVVNPVNGLLPDGTDPKDDPEIKYVNLYLDKDNDTDERI